MSLDSAQAFIKKLQTDKEFSDRIQDGIDEERKNIIAKAGFDFTNEELKQATQVLSDEELRSISGGTERGGKVTWPGCPWLV
ncbi:MAG: Nif11-like leader peptide family natural product precursor [Methanomicrobiales archaeon]